MPTRTVPNDLGLRLRAAANAIADRGYDQVRIDDICEATGIPSSTLYYYFAGKHDVLAYLLAEALALVAERVRAALEPPDRAPRERLGDAVRALLEVMADNPATCRLLIEHLGSAGRVPEIADQVRSAFHEPIALLLTHAAADGTMRATASDVTASAIFGAVAVCGLHYLVAGIDLPVDDVTEIVLDLFNEGLAPR